MPLSPLCPHLSGLRNPAWCLPGLPSSSWLPRQCWFSSKARGGFASTHPVLRTHQAHHSSHLFSGFAGDEQNFPDCCLLQECCLLIIINDSLRLLLLPILINWVIATISLGGVWGWHVQKNRLGFQYGKRTRGSSLRALWGAQGSRGEQPLALALLSWFSLTYSPCVWMSSQSLQAVSQEATQRQRPGEDRQQPPPRHAFVPRSWSHHRTPSRSR